MPLRCQDRQFDSAIGSILLGVDSLTLRFWVLPISIGGEDMSLRDSSATLVWSLPIFVLSCLVIVAEGIHLRI